MTINEVRIIFEKTFNKKISFIDMIAIQKSFDIPKEMSDVIDDFVEHIKETMFKELMKQKEVK
tara:strand:+ start:296 stop:484 length:189 start_codon:yes stop_codon:yes gene_type:complete